MIATLRKFYQNEFTAGLWGILDRDCNAAIKINIEGLLHIPHYKKPKAPPISGTSTAAYRLSRRVNAKGCHKIVTLESVPLSALMLMMIEWGKTRLEVGNLGRFFLIR